MDQYRIDVTLATMYNIIERGGRYFFFSNWPFLQDSLLRFCLFFVFFFSEVVASENLDVSFSLDFAFAGPSS